MLSTLCPAQVHCNMVSFHGLEVFPNVLVYFTTTASNRKSYSLVIPDGPSKGEPVSHFTVSPWLRQIIIQAYRLNEMVQPF